MIKLSAIAQIFQYKGAISACMGWSKFSVTSFNMISALHMQGISPKSVIDVGANVGQFAVASANIFSDATVYAFEPNPECVSGLRKNVASLPNVKVYSIAVGETEGEVSFHVNSHSHSSSILPLAEHHLRAFPDAREINKIQVKLSTLDKVFSDIELASPVMLKLDVQGYEAKALRGAVETLKRVDYVVLEASFKPMYRGEMVFMDIVNLMEGFGFIFLRPVGMLSDPETNEIIQMDALFQRNSES